MMKQPAFELQQSDGGSEEPLKRKYTAEKGTCAGKRGKCCAQKGKPCFMQGEPAA